MAQRLCQVGLPDPGDPRLGQEATLRSRSADQRFSTLKAAGAPPVDEQARPRGPHPSRYAAFVTYDLMCSSAMSRDTCIGDALRAACESR